MISQQWQGHQLLPFQRRAMLPGFQLQLYRLVIKHDNGNSTIEFMFIQTSIQFGDFMGFHRCYVWSSEGNYRYNLRYTISPSYPSYVHLLCWGSHLAGNLDIAFCGNYLATVGKMEVFHGKIIGTYGKNRLNKWMFWWDTCSWMVDFTWFSIATFDYQRVDILMI